MSSENGGKGTPRVLSRRDFLAGTAAGVGGGLLLGGAGLLAGCGRPDSGASTGVLDSGEPRRGGRVRLGILEGAQTGDLDAHRPLGTGSFRGWVLYSKLWEWDLDARPALALAESTEVNHDGTEWIIRLKPGLEFHHGKTISADDVIFSLLRLTDPELAAPGRAQLYDLDKANIRKLDERTVRIPFLSGRVALPELWMSWGGIVPTDYDPITNPVGAGPYRLKSFRPGQRSLFTRFENYYKPGQPYFDEVEIIDFSDQLSRLMALQAGQIDIAPNIAPELLQAVRSNSRLQLISSETDAWQSFTMNLKHPPFDDVRVRQAFRLIADREELVERVFQGYGRVANDLYAPSDPTYNRQIPQRRQDLAEARRLLEAAGYGDGLEVELTTVPGVTGAAGLVLAQQARQVGVNIKLKFVDSSILSGPNRNNWPFSTASGGSRPLIYTLQHTDGPRSAANRTQFHDEDFSQLVLQALSQADVDKRRELVAQIQQIQHDRGGYLIWGFSNMNDAIAANIGGVTPDRTGFAAWRTDRIWRKAAT